MDTDNELRQNLDKLHTAVFTRKGKNWYVDADNCVITVNAYSFTIITAHKKKGC